MRSFRTNFDHGDEEFQNSAISSPSKGGDGGEMAKFCNFSSRWSKRVRQLLTACITVPLVVVQCFIVLELMIMGPRYHICVILVLVATRVPYLCPLAKVVPFSKIFMDPSDPKHVAKLLKGSDGPGVVNATRTHRWGAL